METLQCIKERRSVRRFTEKKVDRQLICEAVEAARWAPSWKNTQTPRFTVIDDKKTIEDIAEHGFFDFTFNKKTVMQAPVLIIISYVKGICGFEEDGTYSTDKKESWQMFDSGVAAQTFALAAHDKGLGTVMLGIYDKDYIARAANIPENQEIAVLLAAGFAQFVPKTPTRKTVDEILNFYSAEEE